MGSPLPRDRHAATWDWAGHAVRRLVVENFGWQTEILDVGAGWGKYREVLPASYKAVDACEVWQPYIEEEGLRGRYRHVWGVDVMDLDPHIILGYDLVILGDVLEHLHVGDAQGLVATCQTVIVVVPFEYPQGPEEGNPYEEHLQPDLTPAVMSTRYPRLDLAAICGWNEAHPDDQVRPDRPFKGLYVRGFDT